MALFGRRKPGFSKEVELKPSEIPGEFSDALDPAVNKELDNPKLEKREMQQQAAQALGETPPVAPAEKPDMCIKSTLRSAVLPTVHPIRKAPERKAPRKKAQEIQTEPARRVIPEARSKKYRRG